MCNPNWDKLLQRAPHRANIWGFNAVAGESITATMDDDFWKATADPAGNWSISLDPQEASTGHTISISFAKSSRVVLLKNVAFGDVYFW